MSVWTRRLALSAAFIIAAAIAGPASAQTKLKWAHVYEVAEPYHTEALWAAEEIKKRTNGSYEIEVFPGVPARQREPDQRGPRPRHRRYHLHRHLVRRLDPQAAGDLRRAVHAARLRSLEGLSRQQAVPRHRQGLRGQDQAQGHRADLLRRAHGDRQQGDQEARGHEGHEAARAAGAALSDAGEIGRRQRHADRLRRSVPRAAAGHRRRPGESAADHHGQEILRGAEPHHADRPHRRIAADHRRQPCLVEAVGRRQEDVRGGADAGGRQDPRIRFASPSRRSPTSCASSARPWSRSTARRSARRRSRCTTTPRPAPAGARRNTTSCRR